MLITVSRTVGTFVEVFGQFGELGGGGPERARRALSYLGNDFVVKIGDDPLDLALDTGPGFIELVFNFLAKVSHKNDYVSSRKSGATGFS